VAGRKILTRASFTVSASLLSCCCTVSWMGVYQTGTIVINQVYIQVYVNNVHTLTSMFLGNTRKVCLHLPTPLHQSLHGHVACHIGQSWTTRQSLIGNHMHAYIHKYICTYILTYVRTYVCTYIQTYRIKAVCI
jgi:hypothetical protein